MNKVEEVCRRRGISVIHSWSLPINFPCFSFHRMKSISDYFSVLFMYNIIILRRQIMAKQREMAKIAVTSVYVWSNNMCFFTLSGNKVTESDISRYKWQRFNICVILFLMTHQLLSKSRWSCQDLWNAPASSQFFKEPVGCGRGVYPIMPSCGLYLKCQVQCGIKLRKQCRSLWIDKFLLHTS